MQNRQWMTKLVDPRFDWRMLQAFLDVAECGAFRAASVERRFALYTLRAHVEKLERLARCELFSRKNEGLTLTPEGEALLHVASAMADARAITVAVMMESAN